jgi:hypothetical protein
VQGDGEVCVTAIETALQGRFRLTLRQDLRLDYPRAETADHYMTMAMDPDLDQCVVRALRDMIVLLGEKRNLSREDAYTLCSLAADLRVTQTVNGSKGTNSSSRGFAGATVAGHFARAGPGFVYFARAGPVPVHFARAASVLGHFSGTGALLGHYARTAHVHGHFSRAGPPLGHLRPVLGHLGPGVGHLVQAARAVPVHLPLPPKPGIA